MKRKIMIQEQYKLSKNIEEMNKLRYQEDCRESIKLNIEIDKAKFKYMLLKTMLEGVKENEVKVK